MKRILLLTFIALATGFNLHAAAGPQDELAPVELSTEKKFKRYHKALNFFKTDQPDRFMAIVELHPSIIRFPYLSSCLDLLREISSTGTCWPDDSKKYDHSFYIQALLQQKILLYQEHLQSPLFTVYRSICDRQDNPVYNYRLKVLIKRFHQYKSGSMHPDLITENIKTPQQWIRHNAIDFLESKKCGTCGTPWSTHRDVDIDRLVRLRKALQLN